MRSFPCYISVVISLLICGCERYSIGVRQLPQGSATLASSYVDTPDFREPFRGRRLFIEWSLPRSVVLQKPLLSLHLIYKDHTQKIETYTPEKSSGYILYSITNEELAKRNGLLTYKATLLLPDGTIYREWKHRLWVNLIPASPDQ